MRARMVTLARSFLHARVVNERIGLAFAGGMGWVNTLTWDTRATFRACQALAVDVCQGVKVLEMCT